MTADLTTKERPTSNRTRVLPVVPSIFAAEPSMRKIVRLRPLLLVVLVGMALFAMEAEGQSTTTVSHFLVGGPSDLFPKCKSRLTHHSLSWCLGLPLARAHIWVSGDDDAHVDDRRSILYHAYLVRQRMNE